MFEDLIQRTKGMDSPTSLPERRWLWIYASLAISDDAEAKCVVECGTLNGISTLFLADGLKEGLKNSSETGYKVITIDNYSNPDKAIDTNSPQQNRELFHRFGYDHLVELVEHDDVAYLETLPDRSIKVAFVDSFHDEGHVSKVLNAIEPKMANNSILTCHDYFFRHSGVVYAVNDWLERVSPGYIGGIGQHETLWWAVIRRKDRTK